MPVCVRLSRRPSSCRPANLGGVPCHRRRVQYAIEVANGTTTACAGTNMTPHHRRRRTSGVGHPTRACPRSAMHQSWTICDTSAQATLITRGRPLHVRPLVSPSPSARSAAADAPPSPGVRTRALGRPQRRGMKPFERFEKGKAHAASWRTRTARTRPLARASPSAARARARVHLARSNAPRQRAQEPEAAGRSSAVGAAGLRGGCDACDSDT